MCSHILCSLVHKKQDKHHADCHNHALLTKCNTLWIMTGIRTCSCLKNIKSHVRWTKKSSLDPWKSLEVILMQQTPAMCCCVLWWRLEEAALWLIYRVLWISRPSPSEYSSRSHCIWLRAFASPHHSLLESFNLTIDAVLVLLLIGQIWQSASALSFAAKVLWRWDS